MHQLPHPGEKGLRVSVGREACGLSRPPGSSSRAHGGLGASVSVTRALSRATGKRGAFYRDSPLTGNRES